MTSDASTRSTLWRHKPFLRLWAAQSLSAVGSRITRTAIPVIAINMLAATPGEAGMLSALGFAPVVAAGLLGGGLVERARKVRLMAILDVVRFGLVMAIPIAFAIGLQNFWMLAIISMAVSAASTLFQNADTSVLPRLVGKANLVEANQKLQTTESIAELAGPGLAGVFIDVLSAPIAVIVDAITFLWSAAWLGSLARLAPDADAPGEAPEENLHPFTQLKDDITVGFRAVVRQPALRALLVATMNFYVSAGFFFGLYMLFCLRELHMSAGLTGIIISMGGVSALGGALLARTLSRRLGFGPAIALTFAVGMAASGLIIPAAIWPSAGPALLFIQQLLSDGAFMAHMILSGSLRQKLLPENEIARANGLFQAIGGIGMMATTLAAGFVADAIGVRLAVIIGGVFALVAILPLLSPALLSVRDEPDAKPPPDKLAEETITAT
jgi:MFS family permease